MVYDIVDVGEEVGSRRLYLLVHFWETQADKDAGKDPVIIEDFYLGIPEQVQVPYVRESGWWEAIDGTPLFPQVEVDGEWVNRPARNVRMSTVQIPVAEEALLFIDRWTQQVRQEPEQHYGRRTVDPSRRTRRSGKGVRPDVLALRGQTRRAPRMDVALPDPRRRSLQ